MQETLYSSEQHARERWQSSTWCFIAQFLSGIMTAGVFSYYLPVASCLRHKMSSTNQMPAKNLPTLVNAVFVFFQLFSLAG